MKKLLTAAVLLAAGLVAYSQGTIGTVNFNNRTASGVDAKIVDASGAGLSGTDWFAQLYFAPGASAAESSLTAVALPPVNFRIGAAAGYVAVGQLGSRDLTGVAPGGDATVQIRAWNAAAGATYEVASAAANGIFGKSNLVNVKAGGGGAPPGPPTDLIGLQGFAVSGAVIPEPTTIALGLLGAGLLFLRRRN